MLGPWRYPFALLGIVFVLIGYALWRHDSRIPVLIYHDVSASARPQGDYTVELALFTKQLDYLRESGYTPLTFATATILREQRQLPAKPVIITFDDALPGQMLVVPLLQTRGIPATFFVTSGLVGDSAHLSWDNIRAIADSGMEIGGHTANHVHPLHMNEIGLTNEIRGDKQHIEAELGKTISVFAYPFQERDEKTDLIVAKAGYTIVRDTTAFRSTVMTNSFESFLSAL